ncbi:MAG: hypothetical protein IK066_11880 [Kiritimatiellae bacterium]|nr:hypothetical protein [Kiritimatiellia bacterium]
MKKLTIVAEMPESLAEALERGSGNLAAWAQDALRRHWEGELEEAGMANDGECGFRVVEARIGKAEKAAKLIPASVLERLDGPSVQIVCSEPGRPGYLGTDPNEYAYDSDGYHAANAFERCGSSAKAIESLKEELPGARELEAMYGTFVGYLRPWDIEGAIAFLEKYGWKFDLGLPGPSAEDIEAGRTEFLSVKLDEEDVDCLQLLAGQRGCTAEECLRQLLEEDAERNREPFAAVEGGAA